MGRKYPVDEHGNRITKILALNDKPPDMDPVHVVEEIYSQDSC